LKRNWRRRRYHNRSVMAIKREEMQKKLQELEEAIAETKKRLPAHSVKPAEMMDLLDLEDQRDEILARLAES